MTNTTQGIEQMRAIGEALGNPEWAENLARELQIRIDTLQYLYDGKGGEHTALLARNMLLALAHHIAPILDEAADLAGEPQEKLLTLDPGSPIAQLRNTLLTTLDATVGILGAPDSMRATARLQIALENLQKHTEPMRAWLDAKSENVDVAALIKRPPVEGFVADVMAWSKMGVDALTADVRGAEYLASRIAEGALAANIYAIDDMADALERVITRMAYAHHVVAEMRETLKKIDAPLPGMLCKYDHEARTVEIVNPPTIYVRTAESGDDEAGNSENSDGAENGNS